MTTTSRSSATFPCQRYSDRAPGNSVPQAMSRRSSSVANELHGFFVGSDRGEHDDGIGVRHGTEYSDLFRRRSGRQLSLAMAEDSLIVRGAREHNLRNIDVTIPRDQLTVITGLSGSGKSSLAFDTIYAEGQRRYVESLSAYARQFLGLMEKPDVDSIEGLVARDLDRAEDRRPQSAVDRRHRHRDLRLPPTALGARRNAALPELRPPGAAAERGADRRDRPHLAARHAHRSARAARAGPQGRIPRSVRDACASRDSFARMSTAS